MSDSRSAPIAIEARDVHKSFTLPLERHTTLKERALRPGSWLRGGGERLVALRGVSFDVSRGEFFGIIGRNGSGKSTLLKLLASIYALDGGSIRIAGKLAPFIELGVGFNPELAARDNVVLNGVMMGLSPAEAKSRFEAVIDYAELHDYTGLKLKNYSSGMQVRLAFALMLQAEADVLLVDEVLAVGDAAFQEKCIVSLEELKRRGTTVVLVTHDMDAVEAHCDRAMLIEEATIAEMGDPGTVAARYLELLFPTEPAAEPLASEVGLGATVTGAWLTDRQGQEVESVAQGEPVTLNFAIRANEETPRPELTVYLINNPEGVTIDTFRAGHGGEIPPLAAGDEITVRVELEGWLRPGGYRFNYVLARPDRDRLLFSSRTALPLRVTGADPVPGVVKLGHRVSVDRGAVRSPG